MADTSMPPSDPTPMPDASAGDMGVTSPNATMEDPSTTLSPTGDNVMMNMPVQAFAAIHALVTQLAQALDLAARDVVGQKMASLPPGPNPNTPGRQASAPATPDEQDLSDFTKELNARGPQ